MSKQEEKIMTVERLEMQTLKCVIAVFPNLNNKYKYSVFFSTSALVYPSKIGSCILQVSHLFQSTPKILRMGGNIWLLVPISLLWLPAAFCNLSHLVLQLLNSYQMDLQLVKWSGKENQAAPGTCVHLMSIWNRKHLCSIVSPLMGKLWKWYC